jgi:hypothetical protein
MAALALLLSWPWSWPGWAKPYFDALQSIFGMLF